MPVTMPVKDFLELAGTDLGVSDWFPIDQGRIDAFADATEDHQFIHVDPVAAAATPFGSTIAHGFLTLSLVVRLFSEVGRYPEHLAMSINYGLNKVRFLAPVPVGSRIRLRAVVADVAERSAGSYLATYGITVEIEGSERPALVAEMLILYVTTA